MSLAVNDPMFDIVLGLCGANAAEFCRRKKVIEAIKKDPAALIAMARMHQVFPYVYQVIKNSNCFASELIARLKSPYQANTLRMLNMTSELVRMAQLLEQNGLRYIPIKGPILAKELFGSPTQRQSIDLDVWISPKDIECADALLAEHGYKKIVPEFELSPRQKRHFFRWFHDQAYLSRNGVKIEVHWRLLFGRKEMELDFDKAWHACNKTKLGNRQFMTLCEEDLLNYLCFHGSKHCWTKLIWLCDIMKFVLKNYENVDWLKILARAKTLNIERSLIEGLSLAHELLGAPLPSFVIGHEQADFVLRAKKYVLRSMGESHQFKLAILKFAHNVAMRTNFDDIVDVIKGHSTTYLDWKILKLPDQLFGLYYVFRPFLLIWRKTSLSQKKT